MTVPISQHLAVLAAEAELINDLEELIAEARDGEFATTSSRDFGRGVALVTGKLEEILDRHSGGQRGKRRQSSSRGGDPRRGPDEGTGAGDRTRGPCFS
jgi:hypothetical protein